MIDYDRLDCETADKHDIDIGGGRPTSGKHYSRHFDAETLSKYLQNATQPPQKLLDKFQKTDPHRDSSLNQDDDLRSTIAK